MDHTFPYKAHHGFQFTDCANTGWSVIYYRAVYNDGKSMAFLLKPNLKTPLSLFVEGAWKGCRVIPGTNRKYFFELLYKYSQN